MNRIDTTKVTDPGVQQPWTTKSLNFLQDSTMKQFELLVKATHSGVEGSAMSWPAMAIHGLEYYEDTLTDAFISDGIFMIEWNGKREVFFCTGAVVENYTGVPLLIPDFTNDPVADPITFSDGSSKSIHQIRNWKIEDSDNTNSMGVQYADLAFSNYRDTYGYGMAPTGSNWTGYVLWAKVNNVVHLNGYLELSTSSGAPALDLPLPAPLRPLVDIFLSVPYVGTGGIKQSIWKVNKASAVNPGALTIESISFGGSTSNTFYFDGLSYYLPPPFYST